MQDLDPKATKRGQVILQKPVCQPSTSLTTFAVTPFPEFLVAASVFVSPRHRHVTPHLIHPPPPRSAAPHARPPPLSTERGEGGRRCTVVVAGQSGRRAAVHGSAPSRTATDIFYGEDGGHDCLRTPGGRRYR
jgi:hypothetical protein